MTLLTICQSLAKNVGMSVPTSVISNAAREWVEAADFANHAGEELARRVDWGQLNTSATLTGDGTNKVHDLGTDFSRLVQGVAVVGSGGYVRPLTRMEWNTLTPVQGTPRYFLLEGNEMTLWPYLATAATVTISYQTKAWCSAGQEFVADTDTALIDEDLLTKCLIVRWRRQKGMDYADFEAEYESALQDFASFDDRQRL